MKEMFKLVFVLTAVSALSGILLAVTHHCTREPIQLAEQRQLFESLRAVLPPADGDPVPLALTNSAGRAVTLYVAFKNGAVAGAAIPASSPNGYGGPIDILLGVTADGTIQGIEFLSLSETPGLGSKIKEPAFRNQFLGKPLDADWRVRKDGGPLDAISGATISSRALCDAVAQALAAFREFQPVFAAAVPQPPHQETP